jgi:cytochrome c biogenesis protein CcmG/thiol:disulfide interchange protein DsbE
MAVLVAVLATRQPASLQVASSPLVGKSAPALVGRTLSGDAQVRLSAYRGRWVLVNFFASWCTVCRSEDPELVKFAYSRPLGSQPVVIGVLYGDTVADGLAFDRSEGATWPAVNDPNGAIASAWGVGSLPRSFLVAPNGKIVSCILGGITAPQLEALVRRQGRAA